MQTTINEQDVIVRGSAEHKEYLRYQFGRIKGTVDGFETRIAVAGRTMLLLYVVYITVKAGMGSALYQNMPPWVSTALLLLDVVMLALQVLGLEGSVPGLIHLSEELEEKGKSKEARTVRRSSSIAQMLVVATAIDIVLQHTPYMGTWDMVNFAVAYSNCLFVLRVLIIGLYLIAMARLEHKGPKVISAHEAAKQREEADQKQIRIDNGAIIAIVEDSIGKIAAPFLASQQAQMQQFLTQHSDALTQNLLRQVDAKLSTSAIDVDALTQKIMRQVDASVNASRVDVDALTHLVSSKIDASRRDLLRQVDAKIDVKNSAQGPARPPVARQAPRTTPTRSTGDTDKIVAINGMTKAAFFAAFEEKPDLLTLSSYKIAEAFSEKNATESTARRAKNDYLEAHPELKSVAV